jgi:hypothetical protein
MEVGVDTALWVAVAAPVLVVGWSMWFAAHSAVSGPAWALNHLRVATPLMTAGLVLGLFAMALVRPVWMGLAYVYPVAIGTWLAISRQRQLALVQFDGGFGEIDAAVKARLASGLSRGLRVAAALAWFGGLAVVANGVAQGLLVAMLGPVAVVTAMYVSRRNPVPSDKSR